MGLDRTRSGLIVALSLCLLATSTPVAFAATDKVLVLLDNLNLQQTHSKFLQNLNSKNLDVTYATLDTKTIKLKDWDDWLYDKLVILGGKTKLGSGVKSSLITEFFDSGHDVFLALDEAPTTQLRELAIALGVDVNPAGNVVIDHFNFDPEHGDGHTAVLTSALAALPAVFSPSAKGPILFKGVGLSVAPESEVAFHAVTASPTAYAGTPGKPVPASRVPLAGQSVGLVTLVQGRNNARAGVVGSVAMLSNDFYAAAAGNAQVAADILKWALSQKGVLRASPIRHRIIGGEVSPPLYRINDDVEVAVDINECGESGCKGYKADDVQIEFVMLDPYIRSTLVPQGNGTFTATVKIPDSYGVFKWVIDYRRLGYSWINDVVTVSVRPFRHYEYERFIVQAYPYYASAASMMAGFFALGFFFLYSR